jgi:two-component system CheB/CheR fusion protein
MISRDETQRLRQDRERDRNLGAAQAGRGNAENAAALKDEFLAIMAHELRHPLNLIHMNVELLSRLPDVRQSLSVSRPATAIRNAVLSQAKLIDDLLDVSRVHTGKLSMSIAPVELLPLVQGAIETTRADPAAARLDIVLQADAPGPHVMADGVRIEQVVMNLLGNAVKFTPAGGTITVRLAREGGSVRLDVSDTGQGIAPAFLPQVFEMFSQPGSVTTRARGGLGIGLALVREIVALHGGRVEAHSEGVSKGARFTVWLPLKECAAQPAAAEGGIERSIDGVRILFVDAVEDSIQACQALLELHGATVTGATSARLALAVLAKQEIDLLVTEISLPRMDGYELLAAARRMPPHANLPAIAVTGLGREKDIAQAREAGFDACVGKPMSIERLVEIIRGLLPRRDDA